ncbi:preprotein translocase subunit SecE [Tenacibaculum maritimum]|uniref:preprotein translocase subunit SecE n=1 Tax=Tenacibaculum maritimum TaxID=107401 RepID=UPI0012E47D86|nr:preprotein translocase subunit SecE [Tenacibaculum maritimum]MCD9580570.1 preprotein translocase subunit SecE [Tenacibaculum maritimum]MCD9634531.1 preprotein translocase subunit SecE [Tenacibaculum maritimum]MDB0600210.1 preprotein translocase subunit SecE [Tenacibaculum maritimum]MDB0613146.1 preprotein translocase subunit SecE [Tenacibaculum maritimum]CAA0169881.1 Protein translocase subunit SecE [Tenacibaculum maritimum]
MNNFTQYIKDSFEELSNNVTWIPREEAQKSTVIVAAFTILFALAVFVIDKVFQTGLDNFFKMFSN